MPIDGYKVTPLREREGARVRVRGGDVVAGEVVMLDLAASDTLTSAAVDPNSLGGKSTASGIRATILPATAGLYAGVVGVATDSASDDLLGKAALESCTVDALVEVSASATVGSELRVARVAGYSVFSAAGAGAIFARLEEDATSSSGDLTFGASALIVKRRVRLLQQGSGGATEEGVTREFSLWADLTDYTPTDADEGALAYVKGGAAMGDGREGSFRIVAAGGLTADGGVVVDLTGGGQAVRQYEGPVRPEWWGAKGDGTTDDTTAIQAAITAAPDVDFAAALYRITSTVTIPSNRTLRSTSGAQLVIDLVAAGGNAVVFGGDNIAIDGLGATQSGLATTPAGSVRVFVAPGTAERENIAIRRARFSDLTIGDTDNVYATHAVYLDDVKGAVVTDCVYDNGVGAFLFADNVDGLLCQRNRITDAEWYPIHLENACYEWIITDNEIISALAGGVYFGGGINVMSQHSPLNPRCERGVIQRNTLRGIFSYGAVIRLQSVGQVACSDNILTDISTGTRAASINIAHIRVATRGHVAGSENGPSVDVAVERNTLIAGATKQRGIYADNQWQTARDPAERIAIRGNWVISTDSSNYFIDGIIIHGQSGGFNDVEVTGNTVTVYDSADAAVVFAGAITLGGTDANGSVSRALIGGNVVTELNKGGSSSDSGIHLVSYCDVVDLGSPNLINNFHTGIRTNAATVTNVNQVGRDRFTGCTNNYLTGTTSVATKSMLTTGGATGSRPNPSLGQVTRALYDFYFDTTLGKPIWWDGTNWVDATGATV